MHVPDMSRYAECCLLGSASVRCAACSLQSTRHERYIMDGDGWLMALHECLASGIKRASDAPFWQVITAVQIRELLAHMSQTDYMLSADACHRRAVQETASGRRLHRPLWPEPPPCRGQGPAPGPPAIKVMHTDGGSCAQTSRIIQEVALPMPSFDSCQTPGLLDCCRSHRMPSCLYASLCSARRLFSLADARSCRSATL